MQRQRAVRQLVLCCGKLLAVEAYFDQFDILAIQHKRREIGRIAFEVQRGMHGRRLRIEFEYQIDAGQGVRKGQIFVAGDGVLGIGSHGGWLSVLLQSVCILYVFAQRAVQATGCNLLAYAVV